MGGSYGVEVFLPVKVSSFFLFSSLLHSFRRMVVVVP
jgi:hypothetical protein